MSLSDLARFFTGFILAIAILFFAGVSTARYLITRLTATPPKPIFPNDSPTPSRSSPTPATVNFPVASPSTSPQTSPSATPTPTLTSSEPGSYQARVTQPIGLVLREGPNRDSQQIGGIEYNQEVTVLGTSPDGEWLQVRLPETNVEGWVKAGNTKPIE